MYNGKFIVNGTEVDIKLPSSNVFHQCEDVYKPISEVLNDVNNDLSQVNSRLSESITDIQNELKQDYAELRELVAEISDNEFYAFSSGFINTGGATTDYTVSQNANYVHTVVDCQEGDKFTYTGATGSNTAKDWAFVSADGTILTKSENIDHYTEVITAPNGAVKLIAQVNKVYFTDKYYLCKGIILKKNVSNTVYELSNVSDSLAYSKFVKILEGMFLDGNGGIATRRGSNTYVFKVSENSVISDMATGGTSMYYSFFGEEPVLGAASFDGQRLFADCSTIKGIKVPNGCKYIAVTNSENVITINPIGVIGDTKKLSTTNKSELVSAVNELNYSTARKPTITFMLDADYDRNKMIVDAFNEKGIKIGVALRLTMLFNYNTEEYYHDFVAKGNEILVHGNYKMGTNAEYSDDEINGFIRQAYTDLDALGFSPKGFVAYQGNCKPVFVPTIKRYFEWGATALNHSAEEESCLYFGNDNPFRLWRYSMQSSTLQQMKNAVDRCIDTNGLLFFYGHAQSSNIGNLTPQNVDALCTYILSKGIDVRVLTPTNAVKEYYAIRYDDIVK